MLDFYDCSDCRRRAGGCSTDGRWSIAQYLRRHDLLLRAPASDHRRHIAAIVMGGVLSATRLAVYGPCLGWTVERPFNAPP